MQKYLKEYASRRNKVGKALKGAVGLVFAGDQDLSVESPWKPHAHFFYLTGVTNEPSAILLLDPSNPVASKREMLFLAPRDPELEQWDGLRMPLSSALRNEIGMASVVRTTMLARVLSDVASRCTVFATLMPNASIGESVALDHAMWKKLIKRTAGCAVIDKTDVVPALRSVKSVSEIALIQEAVNITAHGFAAALSFIQAGVNEFQVQSTLEHNYAMAGGRGAAYPTIVGSGINSTVLHYNANDRDLVDGDLVCIDSGASYRGYGADITRTIPVSGKFTKRQRELYEIVLKAEEAAIRAVKVGATLSEIDGVARSIIVKEGYGDNFIHGIGHHLGVETHDNCGPIAPLKKGAVVTIEPGIYLPDEAIGIRIEDDIVVTANGRKNLSKAIPKTIAEIEKAMRN